MGLMPSHGEGLLKEISFKIVVQVVQSCRYVKDILMRSIPIFWHSISVRQHQNRPLVCFRNHILIKPDPESFNLVKISDVFTFRHIRAKFPVICVNQRIMQ